MKQVSQGSRATLLISDEQWRELEHIAQGDRAVTVTTAYLAGLSTEEREDLTNAIERRVAPKEASA